MQNQVHNSIITLYPFGFGLSYTKFTYDKLKLSAKTMKKLGSIQVSVAVTNVGKVKGDEIVQLYIHDKVSSVTRPIMELKDFKRVTLESGQTQIVKFKIDRTKLAFWDIKMKYVVEPGEFEVMVGKSCKEYLTASFKVL